jgi:hypothetical protein
MIRKDLHRSEYADFYKNYIEAIPENTSLPEVFSFGVEQVLPFFSSLTENQMAHAYAEGKWTLKEMLLHIIDSERIFAYRALSIARRDKTKLPGYEQDDYVLTSNANNRTKESLLEEYSSVRAATVTLFKSFTKEDLIQTGVANNVSVSVRAIGFIIGGHERHHLKIAKERYL